MMKPLGKPRNWKENNIKMNLKEISYDWMDLARTKTVGGLMRTR
jgi:hypothetical protein